jgi:hypothetical protein
MFPAPDKQSLEWINILTIPTVPNIPPVPIPTPLPKVSPMRMLAAPLEQRPADERKQITMQTPS